MTDEERRLHELNLRLYKGIVHAWETYARTPDGASFLPIAAHLRHGADQWDAYLAARRRPLADTSARSSRPA